MEIEDIAFYAQLASILEASAVKPGNVNPEHDFADTKYEHFVKSSIALGDPALVAARRGHAAGTGEIETRDINVGKLIEEAVLWSSKWTYGRNTNLGIAMLLIPLSCSAGMALAKNNDFRENINPILKDTTYKDTLNLYAAVRHADPGGLGSSKRLDVHDPVSDKKIKDDGINIFDVMNATKGDSVARELANSYDISFNTGYPAFLEKLKDGNTTDAIVHAYLTILSKVPDTLIARKNDMETAKKVTHDAEAVMIGKMNINDFDKSLRTDDNRLNPGTTADIVASTLMIALLKGEVL
jgi:triphosphoribosyl-dephospho-CoA synthase